MGGAKQFNISLSSRFFLWIISSLYNLGGTEVCSTSLLATYSGISDFFMREAICISILFIALYFPVDGVTGHHFSFAVVVFIQQHNIHITFFVGKAFMSLSLSRASGASCSTSAIFIFFSLECHMIRLVSCSVSSAASVERCWTACSMLLMTPFKLELRILM
jgi:hypothetical protein